MLEIGIDITEHRSKHIKEFEGREFDYVITVCDNAKESCPFFPGKKVLHWPVPDPPHHRRVNEEVKKEFRKVRDLVVARFKQFAEEGFDDE